MNIELPGGTGFESATPAANAELDSLANPPAHKFTLRSWLTGMPHLSFPRALAAACEESRSSPSRSGNYVDA